jgi:tctex1 domain-containing protein 2
MSFLWLLFTYVIIYIVSLGKSRYKIVVQTTIAQMRDQGVRVASRCLWDPTTDNYASCSYSNVSRYFYCIEYACYLAIY